MTKPYPSNPKEFFLAFPAYSTHPLQGISGTPSCNKPSGSRWGKKQLETFRVLRQAGEIGPILSPHKGAASTALGKNKELERDLAVFSGGELKTLRQGELQNWGGVAGGVLCKFRNVVYSPG